MSGKGSELQKGVVPPINTNVKGALILPLPTSARKHNSRSPERQEVVDAPQQTSETYTPRSTFDIRNTTAARSIMKGAPRRDDQMLGVDLYEMSKRPGPGHYIASGFTGRDRSCRLKHPFELVNCRAPLAQLSPRKK